MEGGFALNRLLPIFLRPTEVATPGKVNLLKESYPRQESLSLDVS